MKKHAIIIGHSKASTTVAKNMENNNFDVVITNSGLPSAPMPIYAPPKIDDIVLPYIDRLSTKKTRKKPTNYTPPKKKRKKK